MERPAPIQLDRQRRSLSSCVIVPERCAIDLNPPLLPKRARAGTLLEKTGN